MKTNQTYRGMSSLIFCILLCSGAANALEIRSYSAATHDRFVGFPTSPVFNETAWFDSHKFTGVGWRYDGWLSQLTLVSPVHVLCATHMAPSYGEGIYFVNADAQVISRTVNSVQPVLSSGNATDLSVVTLSAPITVADKVTPFSFLNLGSETNYANKELVIFGGTAKAGYGKISQFLDAAHDGAPVATRVYRFDYRINPNSSSTSDDAYGVVGDSGSPSFVVTDGKPSVVGLHYVVGSGSINYYTYDSFIPAYITQLNVIMSLAGYRMTPSNAPSVMLGNSMEKTPSTFVTGEAASCRFDVTNYGSSLTGNVTLSLRFPPGASPDSISAPGWVAEVAGPSEWQLRKATLGAIATASATAQWASFPARSSLYVKISCGSDGAAQKTHYSDLAPASTYASWAAIFSSSDPTADSDDDGISNLFEYAFGGDPQTTSTHTVGDNSLLPAIKVESGLWSVHFPVRSDALTRGLEYEIEYSPAMETGTWSTTPPATVTTTTAAYASDVEGFQERTVSFDIGSMPNYFSRVRVKMTE